DLGKTREHLGRFHAFGDRLEAHGVTDLRDRLDHAAIDVIGRDVLNELAVDLQIVDRQILEVHEGRQSAAEIVERELTAARAELAHEVYDVGQVRDCRRLRDFEAHGAWTQVVRLQLVDQEIEEAI